MSKAMSLKAKIRNIAKQKNIPAQVILQNYMFERLMVRLSASEYKEKFVLKGGMLVAAIVGLDNRATMDMDTTLKNLPLTPEAIRSALESVCSIGYDDGVSFELGKISPIREDDIYGGYRVMVNARFDTMITPLSIDVSTGDVITPHAVQYSFSEIFEHEKSYNLWAYNIETVMAEKVETIEEEPIVEEIVEEEPVVEEIVEEEPVEEEPIPEEPTPEELEEGEQSHTAVLEEILGYMEEEGLIPRLTSIWLQDLGNMSFLYDNRIRVELGTTNSLEYKMQLAGYLLRNENGDALSGSDTGTLDCSHITQSGEIRPVFSPDAPLPAPESQPEENGQG